MTAPQRPLRIGLTGGVASGKSTVAALFAALPVPVIDLDQVSRDVVAPGSELLGAVAKRFGSTILQPDGALDRRALRSVVFADSAARADLEALLHPAIRARTEALVGAVVAPYVVIVNPLIAEQKGLGQYDRVLLIDCDTERQRERLARRDGSSPTEVDAMLGAQATREARRAIAQDVIQNDADTAALASQVRSLHGRYLEIAANSNLRARPPSSTIGG